MLAILAILPLLPATLSARLPIALAPRQASVSAFASASASIASVVSAASSAAIPASASASASASALPTIPASLSAVPSGAASASASASAASLPPAQVTVYPYNSPAEGVTIRGQRDLTTGSDRYLGIPFAAPPTSDLRWQPPSLPTWNASSFNATQQLPACLQSNGSLSGSAQGGRVSEDCLYLNVFTPAGANAQTAYLPVLVWVYGGGFTSGTASTYDSRLLVATGVQSQQPFIVVVPNYRVGVLGWPYGKEAAANGAANLGLKDVQFALEWTRDNIWAWGGDPSRVTIAGQSAGAIIISHLLLQQDLDLFRSAIIQSGGASVSPIGPTESTWQAPFDLFAQAAGCKAATGQGNGTSASASAPAASRSASVPAGASASASAPASAVSAASSAAGSVISGATGSAASAASALSSVALAGRQLASSAASVASGVSASVASASSSIAVGTAVGSGVASISRPAPSASASASAVPQDVWQCLKSKSSAQILAAQEAVLDSPQYSAGFVFAPSIDGETIPGSPHELIANGQFRKIPQINGNVKDEGTFLIPQQIAGPTALPLLFNLLEPTPLPNATIARVLQLYPYDRPDLGSPFGTGNETFGLDPAYKQASAVAGDATFQASRRWATRNQGKYAPGEQVWAYLFNQTSPGNNSALGVSHGSDVLYLFGAPRLGAGGYTANDAAVSVTMALYWTNFINNQDPNGSPALNLTQWPSYGGEAQNMLKIQAGNVTVIRDDYREEQIAFFNSEPQQFNLKRSGLAKRMWTGL